MLEVFDRSFRRMAVLQNAFAVSENKKMNAVSLFEFSLPDTDPKNDLCKPFHYVRYNGGDLYRIMPSVYDEGETGRIHYQCEHVIALLIDTILFGFVTVGGLGYYTRDVLEYILSRQRSEERHWVLGECDFSRQFEYGWEQENLLAALFSVPNRFVDRYIWSFDTHVYPFRLSLKRLDESSPPDHYARSGHNRIQMKKSSEPRQICTRIYPLGAGEGVNQLGIKELNGGLPYLQSPQEYVDRHGIIERAWVDRRYTDGASLMAAAQTMLRELQEPLVEYEVQFQGDCELGDIVEIVGFGRTFVTEIRIAHEEVPDVTITVANKPVSIASTVADLADRQRIEMTYSQGATQIYSDSIADNADADSPLELNFFLPDSMINVNAVRCKIRLSAFRAYSKATSSGGSVQTSSNGGGSTQTSSSGGGGSTTSASGGGTVFAWPDTTLSQKTTSSADGGERHSHQVPGSIIHWPKVSIDAHTHSVSVPTHTHSVSIPTHTHTLDTRHTHDIAPIIQRFGGGRSFWLLVGGEKKLFVDSTGAEIDITEYLIKNGRIPRGIWHTVGILPDTLSRVEISCNIQGFIQSRGDRTV